MRNSSKGGNTEYCEVHQSFRALHQHRPKVYRLVPFFIQGELHRLDSSFVPTKKIETRLVKAIVAKLWTISYNPSSWKGATEIVSHLPLIMVWCSIVLELHMRLDIYGHIFQQVLKYIQQKRTIFSQPMRSGWRYGPIRLSLMIPTQTLTEKCHGWASGFSFAHACS